MSLPRLWRTVRRLTAEQWLYLAIRRGRRVAMQAFPAAARGRIERAAAALPMPDPAAPRLAAVARPVLALQNAVHGDHLDGIAAGRFVLLNRTFDFGGADRIPWRGEFHEGNNPLRRMTLAYMGYAVPLLARGGAAELQTVRRLLRRLENANPWSAPGVFRDVWNPYAASHRLINLLAGLSLYRAAGATIDPAAEAEILVHVRFCAAFVRANLERDLQYNHLLKNHVALAAYASALPALPGSFAFLAHAIPRALARNVLPDGGHAERSPMYHVLSMLDMDVLRASGVLRGREADRLADIRNRMGAALRVMSHPDGDIALFNDSWLGEAPAAGGMADLSAVAETARLADTGYVRLGRGGDAVIFDCGPCGPDDNPGHAHADFLSLEASVGGARFIVDPGVPTYTAGAARDASRSAASHNGPHLVGEEPIEFWKSFRVGRRGRASEIRDKALGGVAPLWCAGRHDGYGHLGVEVRRFVGLWPGAAMLICDLWDGPPETAAAANFLIPASWTPGAAPGLSFANGGRRVRLAALIGDAGEMRSARYWPRFGAEEAAHRVEIRPAGGGSGRRAAVWIAWSDAATPPDNASLTVLLDKLRDC
jgi:hypothetical protein